MGTLATTTAAATSSWDGMERRAVCLVRAMIAPQKWVGFFSFLAFSHFHCFAFSPRMDADIWSLVLPHLSFSEQCSARGTEKAARSAYAPIEDLIIRRRTTEKGASFALAVRQHVLTPHSKLLTLVLHHIPLGGEGALILSRGYFGSLQLLDITNCAVTDFGAAQLIWNTKDVPVLVLDRNPIAELAFDALTHKYFHLSAVAGEEFVIAIRKLPEMSPSWIRMLTWGLLQVTTSTSTVVAHCTPLDKVSMALFQRSRPPRRIASSLVIVRLLSSPR